MSQTKQLILLFDSLEKREFDKIIKIYLNKEYGYESIIFTDGKNDSGIDIKVFDFKSQKIQYQLTTQKSSSKSDKNSFEKKLIEDLIKAKKNVDEHGYKDKLIFFYSKPLTNERINNYVKLAFKEYDIHLEIIESNRLAQECENIIEIQEELYKINELDKFKVSSTHFENTLFYDLLSFGRPTEFKTQVIESFVLQLFYSEEKITKDFIIKSCEEKFEVIENDVFYDRLLNRFLTDKKIIKHKPDQSYSLTAHEKENLKIKNEQFGLDKTLFVNDIGKILENHGQELLIDEYIVKLKELYVENFNTDLKDVLSNETEFHITSIFKPFISFVENNVRDKSKAKNITIELLNYCLSNKFIQKLAATKVYSSKIDNTRLQNYINKRKKLFVDTSVGLFSLCLYYKPTTDFDNYFFKATKSLIDYARKEKIMLYISERYIWEMQNHLRDAFRLIPFSQIENFSVLGSSRNVFYNFYNFLVKSAEIDSDKSFADFLNDFGFSEGGSNDSFNSIIEHSLSQVNILKQEFIKDYKIDEANRLFDEAMRKYFKTKTNFGRNCDSIMLEFLADKDVSIHPVEPVFLTWDKTFFEAHGKYLQKFPNSQNWMILTPNKIVDIYALLKFSITSETITENLLALISDDIISNTHTLVDTLTFILNPNDEVGLEYTSRLAGIRDKEINQIHNAELTPPENFEGQAVIDNIFLNLTNYFKDDSLKINEFRALFTKKELIDEIMELLVNAIGEFYKDKSISDSLYKDFEKLIERNQEKEI
ncbi:hypothetical protein [Flavobacterium sp. C4GT6]|uniref:hypothetical protein n=1 Tax=Flavobacterium sp. C4GT6 TaxID=3103818 RepID=UPI002ED1F737